MLQIHQGVDIVEVTRFKKVFQKNKDLASDVFTEKERAYCLSRKDPYIHFAGRFAAKEACLKALGMGLSTGIDHTLREIEVLASASGKPVLSVKGWAARTSKRQKINQLTVSISHSANYAVATVILVGNKN
ncbi:holo-[acyl-carrier-protein] synthase [bacterium BMS3Abin10]|nr:holo-[acyl-carrier-protein] synthase [bacterium BMS3Abin10]